MGFHRYTALKKARLLFFQDKKKKSKNKQLFIKNWLATYKATDMYDQKFHNLLKIKVHYLN